jgi:hypothetical protein
MKNSQNIIFIDISATLFPHRVSFLPNNNRKKLAQLNLEKHICNTQADFVAVNLLNELNKKWNFNLVLIDSWISENHYKREIFEEVLYMNGVKALLHNNWFLKNNDTIKSPLGPITEWMQNSTINNYTVILNQKYQYQLDFDTESKVDFNHSIFIDEENGLSFKDIIDVNKSIKLWL